MKWRPQNAVLVMLVLFSINLAACQTKQEAATPAYKLSLNAPSAGFGKYQEYPVNVTPSLKPYTVAPDLSNISNANRFEFSPQAQALLAKNAFVVIPGSGLEFFGMYEPNRYDGIPNFISTDSMLHNYHLFFNHLLKTVEKEKLAPALQQLNVGMLNRSSQIYEQLRSTPWENAARRNLAFFAVGSRLMDPQVGIPSAVQAQVEQELALIQAHHGFAVSPVMNMSASQNSLEDLKEDYSQYIPRGHYSLTPEMQRYFQAMMWYGRLTFRLKDLDETRSAALITLMLNQDRNLEYWEEIYQPTSFFAGQSDDLDFYQYLSLLQEVYGNGVQVDHLLADPEKWQVFVNRADKLKSPHINSIPIFDASIQPDREQEIKGFRFMGQRFTLDASIFQRLVYREVREKPDGQRRMLPRGLDLTAAMGSAEAYAILQDMGETAYPNYPENMQKLQSYIKGLEVNIWTQNLYWTWLYTLKPLTQEKSAGYPSFMLNQAWLRKELATYLSSWTELKHDTILYAKQTYAEMGGGPSPSDDRGYVEPNPYLYSRLASLSALTRDGLASRGLLNNRDKESLDRMVQLALSLKTIAEKELNNQPRSDSEYQLIRTYGGQLEHFWLESLGSTLEGRLNLWDHPAALVADVASSPGSVLEEGTGFISFIYVVAPVDNTLRIAKGAVYSYYEFEWPLSDRLSDARWVVLLRGERAPAPPDWTTAFTAPGPVQAFQ